MYMAVNKLGVGWGGGGGVVLVDEVSASGLHTAFSKYTSIIVSKVRKLNPLFKHDQ